MWLTYDISADAVYIYFFSKNERMNEKLLTYPCDPTKETGVDGMINLDIYTSGKIDGIEILGARSRLSKQLWNLVKEQIIDYKQYGIDELIHIKWDRRKDIAYIYFGKVFNRSEVGKVYRLNEMYELDGIKLVSDIDLFFDKSRRLIGTKLSKARAALPQGLFESAKNI